MKRCQGISMSDYFRDSKDRRYAHSPLAHYPDFCPYFKDEEVGDCLSYQTCGGKDQSQRPCLQKGVN